MQKLKTLFKRLLKSPLIAAAIVCFVLALATLIFTGNQKHEEVKSVSEVLRPKTTVEPTVTTAPTETLKQKQTNNPSSTVTPTQGQSSSNSSNENAPAPTAAQTNTQTQNNLQVNLSVNGSGVGSVTVSSGANQCDVLTTAESQGKISGLLMKYDNSLGTNGVYKINAVGKDNAVWWVYKVNGASPGQGCSLVKAANGDNVEWEYIGN